MEKEEYFEFEELSDEEKVLLLSAFDYTINGKREIIDGLLKEPVRSDESVILTLDNAAFMNGSLKIINSDPLTISRFIREIINNEP